MKVPEKSERVQCYERAKEAGARLWKAVSSPYPHFLQFTSNLACTDMRYSTLSHTGLYNDIPKDRCVTRSPTTVVGDVEI